MRIELKYVGEQDDWLKAVMLRVTNSDLHVWVCRPAGSFEKPYVSWILNDKSGSLDESQNSYHKNLYEEALTVFYYHFKSINRNAVARLIHTGISKRLAA